MTTMTIRVTGMYEGQAGQVTVTGQRLDETIHVEGVLMAGPAQQQGQVTFTVAREDVGEYPIGAIIDIALSRRA